jgi:hypothetical protein
MAEPLEIFISYSHRDREHKRLFLNHFSSLTRTMNIGIWTDDDIDAGNIWDNTIQDNLARADLIILLVSANFISSDYIYHKELKPALALQENKKAVIIPVLLSNCSLTAIPIGAIQTLPTEPRYVDKWDNCDDAWVNVIEGIRKAIHKMEEDRKTWDPVSAREEILKLLRQTQKLEEACNKAIDFAVNYGDMDSEFEAVTIRTKLSELGEAEGRKPGAIPPPPLLTDVLDIKQGLRMEIYRLLKTIFGNLSKEASSFVAKKEGIA